MLYVQYGGPSCLQFIVTVPPQAINDVKTYLQRHTPLREHYLAAWRRFDLAVRGSSLPSLGTAILLNVPLLNRLTAIVVIIAVLESGYDGGRIRQINDRREPFALT